MRDCAPPGPTSWALQGLYGWCIALTERAVVLCEVYRSDRKSETYLYLMHGKAFDELPAALRQTFGTPSLVMRLKLDPGRRLAHADVDEVMDRLREEGFYLQLPPEISVEEDITRRLS